MTQLLLQLCHCVTLVRSGVWVQEENLVLGKVHKVPSIPKKYSGARW